MDDLMLLKAAEEAEKIYAARNGNLGIQRLSVIQNQSHPPSTAPLPLKKNENQEPPTRTMPSAHPMKSSRPSSLSTLSSKLCTSSSLPDPVEKRPSSFPTVHAKRDPRSQPPAPPAVPSTSRIPTHPSFPGWNAPQIQTVAASLLNGSTPITSTTGKPSKFDQVIRSARRLPASFAQAQTIHFDQRTPLPKTPRSQGRIRFVEEAPPGSNSGKNLDQTGSMGCPEVSGLSMQPATDIHVTVGTGGRIVILFGPPGQGGKTDHPGAPSLLRPFGGVRVARGSALRKPPPAVSGSNPSALSSHGNASGGSPDAMSKKMEGSGQSKVPLRSVSSCQVMEWTIPVSAYANFVVQVRKVPGVMQVYPLPSCVQRALWSGKAGLKRKEMGEKEVEVMYQSIPSDLRNMLMPYQVEGVKIGLQREGRLLLADEMGLGKTMQAIALASAYIGEWPLLVICPSSLRTHWGEQMIQHIPGLEASEVDIIMKGKQYPQGKVVVISYGLAANVTWMEEFSFQVVIADESHYVKNYKAKRTQAIIPILRRAKRTILLTGTPALSRPIELFTQLNALNRSLFPSMSGFGKRYCDARKVRVGYKKMVWDYSGSSNLPELYQLLRATLMVRRQKKDVLNQLPPKVRERIYVSLLKRHQNILGQYMKELRKHSSTLQNSKNLAKKREAKYEMQQLFRTLYQTTGTSKLPAVIEFVKDMLEHHPTMKMIIFGHHRDVVEGIARFLQRIKVDFIRIDGQTPQTHRQPQVDHFQKEKTCRVALLSITAAGVGLTLTKASTVIFAELFWNPGSLRQAEDRAHRIGQESCVNVYYLVAKDTLDEKLWNVISKKLQVVGEAINGMQGQLGASTSVADQDQADLHQVFGMDDVLSEIIGEVDMIKERENERRERYKEIQAERMRAQLANPRGDKFFQKRPVSEVVIPKREGKRSSHAYGSNISPPVASHHPGHPDHLKKRARKEEVPHEAPSQLGTTFQSSVLPSTSEIASSAKATPIQKMEPALPSIVPHTTVSESIKPPQDGLLILESFAFPS